MTLDRSAFGSDILSLGWWDLLRLALGMRLKTPGLVVQRASALPSASGT